MKKMAFVLGISLMGFTAFGQLQVGNSDFEDWGGLGSANERPTNWNNMKNGDLCGLCGFGSIQTVWRSSDVRPGSTGSYSAQVKTGTASGKTVNGNMTLGRLTAPSAVITNPAAGYNVTVLNDAAFSEAFTGKPDSLVIWAKYSVTTAGDSARVSATIHDNYEYRDPADAGSESHWVAKAVRNFQTNGEWMRISIPFDYEGAPVTTSGYILVSLASSYSPGSGISGASLLVDDLEMIYNPTVDVAPTAVQNLLENEAGNELTATESTTSDSREWKYSTTSGSGYVSFATAETDLTYTPLFATAGTYYVVCESVFNGNAVTSNEVQINVEEAPVVAPETVSIAPTAVQNLLENEAGEELTATESATPDSREWKVSTTSGPGYVSFTPAETDATYTPLFDTEGTYYVVCESVFNGDVIVSNEVQINVTKEVSVKENTFATATVYGVNQNVMVDFTGMELDATISIYASNGQKIATQKLNANQLNEMNINVVEGIYFYVIENQTDVMTGKVFIH